jgi:hypothetical protein
MANTQTLIAQAYSAFNQRNVNGVLAVTSVPGFVPAHVDFMRGIQLPSRTMRLSLVIRLVEFLWHACSL